MRIDLGRLTFKTKGMKDRFKYIIFQYFTNFNECAKFLGQSKESLSNMFTPKGKLPGMAKFVIHVFDKLEEENRELTYKNDLLKKQIKIYKDGKF